MTKIEKSKKARIHIVYKTSNGQRVPSVTTILGILNKPALVAWAWDLGTKGIDYRQVRDTAGNIGTLAHLMILCDLKGEIPDISEYSKAEIDMAETCLLKYWDWERENPVEPMLVEHSFVSEQYHYGGTIDCLAKLNGKLILIDYKTGKGIYAEVFHQLAAYRQLLVENGHNIDSARILRIGRDENEGFEVQEVGNLDKHLEIFLSCKRIYELQKEVKP